MTTDMAPQSDPAAPLSFRPVCRAEDRWLVLVAAILASAMGFIDGTVVAIAMPAMRASLDASLVQAQWIHNAYMLTLSALILAGGALGDRFGLVRMFRLGIALFVAASLVCALAPTAALLIGARAVQGVGAAVMVPGSMAIIARAYPPGERGRAIGIWAAASALTTAAGPVIGGLALSIGGDGMWRWIFAVNLPLGVLTLWLLTTRVHDPDAAGARRGVDWAGALLATAGLGALAWGLTHSGGLRSPWVLAALALLAGFVWAEARSPHPMLPLSLFRIRVFSVVNLLCFSLYAGLNIALFYLPMALIAGWGISAFAASVAFAPLTVFISAMSSRMGMLGERWGAGRMLASGSAVVAVGYAAMTLALPGQMYWQGILPAMCIVGFGMAMVVAPLSTAVMGAVSEDRAGTASGVNNAITRLAGLIAVAATGGLVARVYADAGGTGDYGVVGTGPGEAAATTAALGVLLWVAAGLSALSAIIAALFLPRGPITPASSSPAARRHGTQKRT